jgi:hypothetical protein
MEREIAEVISLNEPHTSRERMLTPLSINEPATLPDITEPYDELEAELDKELLEAEIARHEAADPDELEEEIEAAEEDGDFKPMHRSKPKHQTKATRLKR